MKTIDLRHISLASHPRDQLHHPIHCISCLFVVVRCTFRRCNHANLHALAASMKLYYITRLFSFYFKVSTMCNPRLLFRIQTTYSFLYSNDLMVHKLSSVKICHPNWRVLDISITNGTYVPVNSFLLTHVGYRKL